VENDETALGVGRDGRVADGTICMSIVATENFYTIDRLLADRANPAFASAVDRLGSPTGRDLLRYLSSELNRL